MDEQIIIFLKNNNVCSLSLALPDGTVHGAAVHYSHREAPLTFYISTDKTSKKAKDLVHEKAVRAALVIGFSESDWTTMQLNGNLRLAKDEELPDIKKLHYAKHPRAKEFESDPDTVFLIFVPTWWRYSNLSIQPPTIIESTS